MRVLSTVSFSNSDLLLLRGEPSDRRKWLDNAICQVYPAYLDKINKYNKIRLQKQIFCLNFKADLHSLLEMAVQAPQITICLMFIICSLQILQLILYVFENEVFIRIKKIAKEKHLSISKDEELNIEYENTLSVGFLPVSELSTICYEKLNEIKDEEIKKGSV